MLAALLFVAGFTTVFVLLGATASALGQVVRQYLSVLSTVAGVAIIAMGLHFLGVFRIGLLYREARFHVPRPVGLWGAYVMGLAFAFGWTPCIGPILAAILAVAGSETSVAKGAVLLAVYSAGLGIPFLLAAFAMKPFAAFMKRMRARFALVERIGVEIEREMTGMRAKHLADPHDIAAEGLGEALVADWTARKIGARAGDFHAHTRTFAD